MMDKGMREIYFLSLGERHFCLSHIAALCVEDKSSCSYPLCFNWHDNSFNLF